jgi:adenosylcobinamide kinase/adenosylcobinamide-phosphate guanylyltransferase
MSKGRESGKAHLILGGARSGKTEYALSEARKSGLEKWMIVTAVAEDLEMSDRIAQHQAERGADWVVVEERCELVAAMGRAARPDRILVVDCLTLWLSNLFFEQKDLRFESSRLVDSVSALGGPVIFVSNEIGLGLVPETRLGRAFRDAQGRLNQSLARACDAVTFVAAGLPLILKPGLPAR